MGTEDNRPPEDHESLLRAIPGLATQYDIFRFMKKVAGRYGMRAFLVARLPEATAQTLQSLSIISSLPAEFVARYDQASLAGSSPAFERLRTTTIPFLMQVPAPGGAAERDAEMRTIATAFGMEWLVMFPVADTDGRRGAVCFLGDGPSPSHQAMLELTALSIHVFDRLHRIGDRDTRLREDLTDREVDCLNWTAAGKTSAEISEILGLSEHTVNHYLNRAARKLDTVNRTQAVARAIRTGIIS
ncbi:MAG: autoinducer binding domain-containing protein [Rhizobiaceae bacterium]|nr:autoinducer binding domain-containing protein [Rhizobiaceae bacterium]